MKSYPEKHRPGRFQSTIAASTTVNGFGLWSGKDVRVEIQPAAANTGVVFVRQDLGETASIPGLVEFRIESPRRTALRRGGATVEMVEHVMAALAAMQIDNCLLRCDAAEMPGFDGSSQAWIAALQAAGRQELDEPRNVLVVTERIRVGNNESWIEAVPSREGQFSSRVRIDYGYDSPIGRQTYELEITPESFCQELADARTFVLKEEADWLVSQGLCQRVKPSDVLVFSDEGPIDNELRFSNECVRHKMLDIVGDLSLAGCDLKGHFIGHCSGHRLNAELVRTLLSEFSVVGPSRLLSA